MGGSRPSPSTVVMPAPAAPTLFQSVTPIESYQDLAEQLRRIQNETARAQEQRYQEVGTPAELGALAKGRRVQESASYLSSLPSGDQFASANPAAAAAATANLTDARRAYAEALRRAGERPTVTTPETPSWARRTIT
jgi:hypothetical protein